MSVFAFYVCFLFLKSCIWKNDELYNDSISKLVLKSQRVKSSLTRLAAKDNVQGFHRWKMNSQLN